HCLLKPYFLHRPTVKIIEVFLLEGSKSLTLSQLAMPTSQSLLMIGLPKGSLEEVTRTLFARAGYRITVSSRFYRLSFDDLELDGRLVRA
ncbi:MAG TPA: hypothetical protein VGA56_20025, partial [Opitutaceae bacterium]